MAALFEVVGVDLCEAYALSVFANSARICFSQLRLNLSLWLVRLRHGPLIHLVVLLGYVSIQFLDGFLI